MLRHRRKFSGVFFSSSQEQLCSQKKTTHTRCGWNKDDLIRLPFLLLASTAIVLFHNLQRFPTIKKSNIRSL